MALRGRTIVLPLGLVMKHHSNMSFRFLTIIICWLALPLSTARLAAQTGATGTPGGLNTSIIHLFGDAKAFSAKAQVQVLDKELKETMLAPVRFSLLEKKLVLDIDLSTVKSAELPAGAAAALKKVGMADLRTLIRPDKKMVYIIYEGPRCILRMPLTPEDLRSVDKPLNSQKTVIGKETLDGHECVKNKVVLSDDHGPVIEAITWNATDLNGFPWQIRSREKDQTSTIRFSELNLSSPDPGKFDPPVGYTEYKDIQEMSTGLLKKAFLGDDSK